MCVKIFSVLSDKDKTFVGQVRKNLSHHFPHVHSRNHFFENLFSWIYAESVNFSVPFGQDEIQFSLISKVIYLKNLI